MTPDVTTPSSDGVPQPPVAIVGMGVLFPGAPDLRTYWENLVGASDAITDVPPRRWDARFYDPTPGETRRVDQIPCRRGGFVDDLAVVEPERFGLPVDVAKAMEPEQLIALRVAAAAVDDAGGVSRLGDPDRIGVVLGRSGYPGAGFVRQDQRVRTARQLVHTLGGLLPWLTPNDLERVRAAFTEALGPEPGPAALGLMPNLPASRIAGWLGLRGPAYTVDAACASSLVAVDSAVRDLVAGRCDVVLAGGAHHCQDVTLWSLLSGLGVLSASQQARPLHAEGDGMLPGEGTGIVILKRLADAQAAGDRIYAVIRGTGVTSDGSGLPEPGSATAGRSATPDHSGQLLAIRRAWAAAGLDPGQPDSVGLIEAHGAGTPDADGCELAALDQVFGPAADGNMAVIGSVKSMIGHAMAAAGIASLVKVALAVHHGVLLPTLNCEQPHPALESTRFRALATAAPWVARGPRRAGVNAFGFGGVNAHVVLEQAPGEPAALAPAEAPAPSVSISEPERVLLFAAQTPEELSDLLDGDDAAIRDRGSRIPSYLGPGSRLGLVGPTERRLAVARRVARGTRVGGWAAWRGRNDVWLSSEPLLAPAPGRIAFVFPGLEAEFAPNVDDVARQFGLPLSGLSSDGIGRHGSGVLRVGRILELALREMGVVPDALAGHSIGEWNAMIAAGMFDEDVAHELIFGSVMDDLAAVHVEYASLACSAEQALAAIADHPEIVLSHDNAPRQAIVCGPPEAIRALAAEQRRQNVLVQIMPFRSGFHTPMLVPYLSQIAERVAAVPISRLPRTELWSATLVDRYPGTLDEIRELELRHLVEPVLFRPMVRAMYDAGVRVFIQAGQGRLGGLIDDTLEFLPHLTIAANSSRRSGLDQLRRVAVALWVEGGVPNFDALETRGVPGVTGTLDAAGASPIATGRAASGTTEPAAVQIKLDLAGDLVTLDPRMLPQPALAEAPAVAGLTAWARRDQVAHELLELITDTAATAVAVLEDTAGADSEYPGWLDRDDPPARGPEPIEGFTTDLRVSVETMPFLLDHCLAPQRPGWPETTDLRPVVPATTIVRLMMDLAERAAPGRVAVGVTEIRFDRWLLVSPPTTVTAAVQPATADTVTVSFGEYARGVIRLAENYPDIHRPLWPHEASQEKPPAVSAAEVYNRRWMFHGPQYQGIVSVLGHSDVHTRAVLTATTAPGSLLDAAGQLLGYFVRVNLPDRYVLFPTGIDRIEFYGPEPAPGTPVTCLAWIPQYDADSLHAFFQLAVDGQVWAEISGWHDRRFDVRLDIDEAFRFPERNIVSERMPQAWTLATERWLDLATRDMVVGRYLGAAEREELLRQQPRARRGWLLGRIAVKDAVRAGLWDSGHGAIFPAELRVTGNPARCEVTGEHGLELPPLRVSIAHSGEVAVAIARPATEGSLRVGIAVEEIREHPLTMIEAMLSPDERQLTADLATTTGVPESVWFTRFWTAKAAAAKALGTGPGENPQQLLVSPAGPAAGQLTVTAATGQVIPVRTAETSAPDGATGDYVVAWVDTA